jgi:hypothetical protein
MDSANKLLLNLQFSKAQGQSKLAKVIKLGYHALLEARSDWLTIETLFIANFLGVDVASIAEMARDIREVFQV